VYYLHILTIQLRIGIYIPTVDGFQLSYNFNAKEYEISSERIHADYFKKKSDAIDGRKKVEAKKIYCPNITLILAFESIWK
jgi:hypothetical protein